MENPQVEKAGQRTAGGKKDPHTAADTVKTEISDHLEAGKFKPKQSHRLPRSRPEGVKCSEQLL